MESNGDQIAIPATWMRGGTSNALFFLDKDLPPPGALRDKVIKRAMGCPDVLQIDGMGGGRGNTSKIAIVGASERDDADVNYTFAQVGIGEDVIDYRATCGNISAAVGPVAILKGLVAATEPVTRIRIYNSNIEELLFQELQVSAGMPRVDGDFVNAGVPGTGAEVFTDYGRAIGTRTGKMLPTGRVRDQVSLSDGRTLEATLLDVGNPVAYVHAADLGIVGNELPAALLSNIPVMNAIAELRYKAAERMGLAGKFSIRVGLVSSPTTYVGRQAQTVHAETMDLCGRFFALDYCAPNYPGSASVSTGAAARIPGSVVYDVMGDHSRSRDRVRIGHPGGVMEVLATARPSAAPGGVALQRLGFGRTARVIMDGAVFVPKEDATV
jgi:2-methylaconitate cis-trans-isomerase PrpF